MIRPIVLCVLFALLVLAAHCHAGYTIVVRDQVSPKYITVLRPAGLQTVLNPGPPPAYPATVQRLVYRSDDFDPYSADPAKRSELWEDGYGVAPSADIFAAFPGLRDWKARQIRTEGARRLSTMTPYLPEERDTWPQQQQEAKEFRANSACACVMIRKIAEEREIAVESLVGKIEENVSLFPSAAGAILGRQQKLLDRIEAEQDFATLLGISWD